VAAPETAKPQFANNSRQEGLVNVSTGAIELLNNVNLAVAANVIASVCDVTIPVAILAQQLIVDGEETFCADADTPITIEQATGGQNAAPAGGNNSRQEGLVNVSLGDVEILNDVNLAVAANVIVSVCDLTVPIALLAEQVFVDGTETYCGEFNTPIIIDQAQG
jgi:hypothetical protein